MNLGELRNAARLRLDDAIEPYLWSDDELNGYINEAVNEACLRARLNTDSTTPEVTEIAVIAGTSSYDVHSSVFFIERVYMETLKRVLHKTSFHDLDAEDDQWQTHTGNPTHYSMDLDHYADYGDLYNKLTLYPIPEADDTIKLIVYRLPLSPMNSDSEFPEIPVPHHPYLVDWVCAQAYQKADADSEQLNRAARFDQIFTSRFGPRPEARRLEWRRKQRPKRVISRWL